MLDDFANAFHTLAANPDIGRIRDELTGPAYRWWHIHRYLIVYDPASQPLRIIRVIHGSRDLASIFGGEA